MFSYIRLVLAVSMSIAHILSDREAPPRLHTLCPNQCNSNFTGGDIKCCQGCSCEIQCIEQNNCCYSSMKGDNQWLGHRCESVAFENHPAVSMKKYVYMVAEKPPTGCHNTSMLECCENQQFPWGTTFPVRSDSHQILFKNINYAYCYGHNHNLQYADTFLICDKISYASTIDPGCSLYFDTRMEKTNQCQLCPEDFQIHPSLNFTKDEVQNACMSDFVADYGKYKNMYCYICNEEPVLLDAYCPMKSSIPWRTVPFLSLFDSKALSIDLNKQRAQASPPSRCEYTSADKRTEYCRPLLCPEGKIWMGSCQYGTTTWSLRFTKLVLVVHLPPGVVITLESLKLLISISSLVSPFPDIVWKPTFLLYRHCTDTADLTLSTSDNPLRLDAIEDKDINITHFYITLNYKRNIAKPDDMFREIADGLARNWTMMYGWDQLNLTHKVTDHAFEIINATTGQEQTIAFVEKWVMSAARRQISEQYNVYKTLILTPGTRPEIQNNNFPITKLFFCNQIALSGDEFKVYNSSTDGKAAVAQIRKTGAMLHTNTFKVVPDQYDADSCQVCDIDYNFDYYPSSGAKVGPNMPDFLSMVGLVVIHTLLVHRRNIEFVDG